MSGLGLCCNHQRHCDVSNSSDFNFSVKQCEFIHDVVTFSIICGKDTKPPGCTYSKTKLNDLCGARSGLAQKYLTKVSSVVPMHLLEEIW